jgi:hypothetical protein
MKALTWHGRGDIRCDSVPDPKIQDGRDAIIEDPPEGDVQCPAHDLLGRECAYGSQGPRRLHRPRDLNVGLR